MGRRNVSQRQARVIPPWIDESYETQREDVAGPYLTIAEAAALVRVSPKRLRNLMADGTLTEGVHYTRPRGLRPRFKHEALLAWLEGREVEALRDTPARPPVRARCTVDPSLIPRVQRRGHGL